MRFLHECRLRSGTKKEEGDIILFYLFIYYFFFFFRLFFRIFFPLLQHFDHTFLSIVCAFAGAMLMLVKGE